MKKLAAYLGSASLALTLPATPAHAGGDITNFKVENCSTERIFVCSFDKTDSLMKIPYKAAGVKPYEKKEFGCASLDKCKVIIGVSRKKSQNTLSSGMEAALATGSVAAAGIAGMTGVAAAGTTAAGAGMVIFTEGAYAATALAGAGTITTMTVASGVAIYLAAVAAGSVAALEIYDGWSDGEVCNQVRKAAQKAGMKPKSFMKNGKTYQLIEQYGTDNSGKRYINPDGTAVITYVTEQGKGACPIQLPTQIVPK